MEKISAVVVSALALFPGLLAQEAPPARTDQSQLASVLNGGREYCRRLETAALNFVCLEEASERINLSRDGKAIVVDPSIMLSRVPPADLIKKNSYSYDYQFIRKDGQIKEKRVLLSINGKKAQEKDAPARTGAFQYADILLAPIQLLDERFSEFYAYRLVREDMLNGEEAWVLEVSPRLSVVENYLGGTLWLRQSDYGILRIDWDPATFGRYESILRRAREQNTEPRVTSFTEFGFEKNGIRFPSLDFTEEGYLGRDGKKFVRAVTTVVYKNYKFFTVETETAIK
jgi:hypothetical protein